MTEPAVLVAREIQDLASSVSEVAAAIKDKDTSVVVNVPEAPPAQVLVQVPEMRGPDVVVHLPQQQPPSVHVQAADVKFSPVIRIPETLPNSYEVEITERDEQGYIKKFIITPQ